MKSRLTEPVLFALNLPTRVNTNDLKELFKEHTVSRITLNAAKHGKPSSNDDNWRRAPEGFGLQTARMDFQEIEQAEKAYATANLQCLPRFNGQPNTFSSLAFCPDPRALPTTRPTGYPRLVKLLQSDITSIQLYDLIRPYGSVALARVDPKVGCIVQFWTEDEAKVAADALKNAFLKTSRLTLQAYDPCSLDCKNISYSIDAVALKHYFSTCGYVTKAQVMRHGNGKSQGLGLISFQNPEEASDAIRRYHGTVWHSQSLVLQYHEIQGEETVAPEMVAPEIRPHPSSNPSSSDTPPPVAHSDVVNNSGSAKPQEAPSTDSTPISPSKGFEGQQLIIDALLAKISSMNIESSEEEARYQAKIRRMEEELESASAQGVQLSHRSDDALRGRAETRTSAELLELLSNLVGCHGKATEELDSIWKENSTLEVRLELERNAWQKKLDEVVSIKEEMEQRLKGMNNLEALLDLTKREKLILEGRLKQAELDRDDKQHAWADLKRSSESEVDWLKAQLGAAEHEKLILTDDLQQAEYDRDKKQRAWDSLETLYQSEKSRIDTIVKEKTGLESRLKQAESDLDDTRHKYEISESRRKLLELEVQRPAWEKARKEQEKKEKEAAEMMEAQRRMAKEKIRKEQEEAARKAREEEARRQREAAEMAKEAIRQRAWAAADKAERDRCRNRDARLCRKWDCQKVLERFIIIIDEFETIKFSETQPLTFSNIPWPLLDNPLSSSFGPQLVTWEKVENFFSHVKSTYNEGEKYNKLVERVHRMFHPDKWRSRAILNSICDPEFRKAIELAGNTVAQAMTPIWRQTRERN